MKYTSYDKIMYDAMQCDMLCNRRFVLSQKMNINTNKYCKIAEKALLRNRDYNFVRPTKRKLH
jgi:hypothetical protein